MSEYLISNPSETVTRTHATLQAFQGITPNTLQELMGVPPFNTLIGFDRYIPTVLDVSWVNPKRTAQDYLNIRASMGQGDRLAGSHWVHMSLVHNPESDTNWRGMRLHYKPTTSTETDDAYGPSVVQLIPTTGEQYVNSLGSQKRNNRAYKPNTDLSYGDWPGAEGVMYLVITDQGELMIKNGPKALETPHGLPFQLEITDTDIILAGTRDNLYCNSPFEIKMPRRIGMSHETLQPVLDSINSLTE